MKTITALFLIWLCQSVAFAGITEKGSGMLFGKDHVFFATAVSGWVLDNQSGVRQGLHMVFYPVGETWANSPAIVYGRAVPKYETPTIQSQVERTLEDFHKNGSPNYMVEKQPSIRLSGGKLVEIFYFSGDQWGNYEAAAYYDEKETINYLVFNARTKEIFKKYINDFLEIALTYKNIYTPPSVITQSKVDDLISESKKHIESQDGKDYETKAIKSVAQQIANIMRDCTSYLSDGEPPPFHLFIRIDSDGIPSELVVYPTNALNSCFKGLMSTVRFPPHEFDTFLLDINMSVTE